MKIDANVREDGINLFLDFCLAASVSAELFDSRSFDDPYMPIRSVEISHGVGDHVRITSLYAEIYPRHLTNRQRIDFPTRGETEMWFREISYEGDMHGHLVAGQFSGPPEWFNLSPQNIRVNRNRPFESITTEWFHIDCEVRQFLEQDGDRYVSWTVDISYPGDSNRPNDYHLHVDFIENGRRRKDINVTVHNPFQHEDRNFWNCYSCHDTCSRA